MGGGRGCPCLPPWAPGRITEVVLEPILASPPEEAGSPLRVRVRGAWHPPARARHSGDPGLPKPVLLSDPRRWQAEVGCVLFLGQVNGWDMTMVTHDQARKRLTKRSEEVVRLLVTRQSLQKAVQQSMLS